jgi:hypothetical protein
MQKHRIIRDTFVCFVFFVDQLCSRITFRRRSG